MAPETSPSRTFAIGVVGARGYAGAELLRIIDAHPNFTLAFAASRARAGEPVVVGGGDNGASEQTYVSADPEGVARREADALVLAAPDGASDPYVDAVDRIAPETVIVDLSADHRFDVAWAYGLPEHHLHDLLGAKRIANPGCYATAIQLALFALLPHLDPARPPHAFGVSGYSGAGTTPSPRNDPDQLADGVTPYRLVDHNHEREVTRHLRRPVRFSPHVAPFFRGLTVTIQATLREPTPAETIVGWYEAMYATAPLVTVVGTETPRVQDAANDPGACIGGVTIGGPQGRDVAAVATLDNLLKGASTQAVQNLNAAFGLDPAVGVLP